MYEVVIGIVGAIIGGFFLKGAEWVYWRYTERRAKWKGPWLATLPAFGNRPERRDKWLFRQRGDTVYAQILRESPADERGLKWNFVGRERESQLLGAYESKDPNSQSYGGIMFTHTGLGKYGGYYLRLQQGQIVQAPIHLERQGAPTTSAV